MFCLISTICLCLCFVLKIRFVNNRVWVFGGYDSDYWNYVWYSNLLPNETTKIDVNESEYAFVANPWPDGYTYTVHDSQFFETWTLSDTTLPAANSRQLKVYEENSRYPECVWLLAGVQCSSTCVYCFNLTTQEFVEWDTLTLDGDYTLSDGAAVLMSEAETDYIYMTQRNGYIMKYDIEAKNGTWFYEYSKVLEFEDPCLTKHPWTNQYLFVVDLTDDFWIYDFESGQYIESFSLTYGRTYAACIVHQNTDEDPYLYVVGGAKAYVERMNLNNFGLDGNGWEVVGSSEILDSTAVTDSDTINFDSAQYFALFKYDKYIFILGGYDTTYEADIVVIDTLEETAFYDSDFTLPHHSLALCLFCFLFWFVFGLGFLQQCGVLYGIGSKAVYANDRVWIFGGYDSQYWNYMWYSNVLPPENLTFDVNVSQYDFVTAGESDGTTFQVFDSETGYFEYWTVSDEVLPVANYHQFVVHDDTSRFPECIWIVGGLYCLYLSMCFECLYELICVDCLCNVFDKLNIK